MRTTAHLLYHLLRQHCMNHGTSFLHSSVYALLYTHARTTHVVCLSRSVGNSAELEWAEPLSAIATAEVAAEEPRTDVRLVVHLRDGGMRFVEGDARLRRSFVTKLASAIRALAAQPGS
mgnify:CR=1 FL=1